MQAGVSITIQHDPQYIDVEVTTLGNADHINVTGDPLEHLAPGASIDEDDFTELETGDSLRSSATTSSRSVTTEPSSPSG